MYKGATGFSHVPEVKLFTYCAANFYTPGRWGAGEFKRLAKKVDRGFALRLAEWCREEGLRTASDALADITRQQVSGGRLNVYDSFPKLSDEELYLQARYLSDKDTVMSSGKTPGDFIELMKTCPAEYRQAMLVALQHSFDNIPTPRGNTLVLIDVSQHSPHGFIYAAGLSMKGWDPYLYADGIYSVNPHGKDFMSVLSELREVNLGTRNMAYTALNKLYRDHERVLFITRRDRMDGYKLTVPIRTYVLDTDSTNRLSGDTMVVDTDLFLKYINDIENKGLPWPWEK